MRLLIAEDDSVSRLNLSAAVQRFGHEVTAAADGATAWEAFQESDYSVVISDWDMPVMDGAKLCKRIRAGATERYVYFILIATRGGKQRYLEGMEAGADDFITKPVDSEELGNQGGGADSQPPASRATARGFASDLLVL